MKSIHLLVAAVALAAGVSAAQATVLTGPYDVIYSDTFQSPASNVNASGSDPNAIVGNAPAVATGLDGGSATATYIGLLSTSSTGTPDTNWDYSGSNSALITSPSANIATSGSTAGEDGLTITNLALPLTPVAGITYDFSVTMQVPAATGGHGLEMAFLYNNGNGHLTSGQAISNNDPAGLILLRDAAQGDGHFVDIFEGTGTNSDTAIPTSTTGPLGSAVTFDVTFTPTGTPSGTPAVYTSGIFNWYVNGTLINPSPVTITGLTGGIGNIQFGDNRVTGGTITNFSLTAVPEPASLGVLTLGALGLLARRRR